MKQALAAKFEQSNHCKNFLNKYTKRMILVEANQTDGYWGVGVYILGITISGVCHSGKVKTNWEIC